MRGLKCRNMDKGRGGGSDLTFEVPFKRLFAPTSQSWMSNIFRESESLGKSSGKKWSQI